MNRLNFFYRQLVAETDLNEAFDNVERATENMASDLGFVGLATGLNVSEAAIPNLTVRVGPGAGYDQQGQRVRVPNEVVLDVSKDENGVSTAVLTAGQSRVLSVFVSFKRVQSEEKTDGRGATVYYRQTEGYELHVVAGAPGATPTPPPLSGTRLLLADLALAFGQTGIANADISTARREWMFRTTSGTQVAAGTAREAIQLLADAMGVLVALGDNTNPDDGASRVGMDTITQGSVTLPQGTVRSGLSSLALALSGAKADTAAHIGAVVAHDAGQITYSGGDVGWADGTALSPISVEAAVVDGFGQLGGGLGAFKVGSIANAGSPLALADSSVGDQIRAVQGAHNAHLNASIGAHAASAISATPVGALTATTVAGQLSQLEDKAFFQKGVTPNIVRLYISPTGNIWLTNNALRTASSTWVADDVGQYSTLVQVGFDFRVYSAVQNADPQIVWGPSRFNVGPEGVRMLTYSIDNTTSPLDAGFAQHGVVRIPAGSSSVVVNTEAASAAGLPVQVSINQGVEDATLTRVRAVASSGFITIYGNAAATAHVRVAWYIVGPSF